MGDISGVLLKMTPEEMADHLRSMSNSWGSSAEDHAKMIHTYLGSSDEERAALKKATDAGLESLKQPAYRRPGSRDKF